MSANITAAVFAAYLKCPTKAYLMAQGVQMRLFPRAIEIRSAGVRRACLPGQSY